MTIAAPKSTTGASPHRLAYPVREAATLLGVGKTKAWELVTTGAIRHIRVGHRVVVPLSAIEEYIAGQLGSGVR